MHKDVGIINLKVDHIQAKGLDQAQNSFPEEAILPSILLDAKE